MNKILKFCFIFFSCIILSSCKSESRFYLEEKYYQDAEYIEISLNDFEQLGKTNYILFVTNNFCPFKIPCDQIFSEFMNNEKISILHINYDEYKKTDFAKEVKYAPSVLVVKKGKIVSYLNAEKDEDLSKYQDVKTFTDWLKNYIYLDEK